MLGRRQGAPKGRGGNNHARAPFATAMLLLLGAIAPLVLPPAPAAAQLLPPLASEGVLNFTQQGVPAEATAENGVLARERALAAGRRLAWERLVAEAGAPPTPLADGTIENMVSSIVIEQERTTPTRYSGRITVNFNPSRVRAQLAGRAPGLPREVAQEVPPGIAGAPAGAAFGAPASNWVEAVATYRSMAEWLELQRRLRSAAPVAAVEVQAIAVDAARLRLGLRAPPPVAAGELAGLGVALVPTGPGAGTGAGPGESWRLGLAGGG
jgi:hypothetical protein